MDIINGTYLIHSDDHDVVNPAEEVVPAPDRNQLLKYVGITVTSGMVTEADDYLAAHPGYGQPQRLAWR